MILVDTSAWIEFLRGTGSPTHQELRRLIDEDARLATTDVVVMELLAGAGDEGRLRDLRRFLLRFTHLPTDGLGDYERAAGIFRKCREEGATIRSLFDCLVAAVALRTDTPVLALDRDYEAIARHTALEPHDF
jgi:predicted nucleic acid-binding protein